MNLFFRLLWISLFSRFSSKVKPLERCETNFTVYPTDLDILRHMNNGIYFSLQDLARVDFMIRCGVIKVVNDNGWYPVVVAETLQFKKSLNPFKSFQLTTQIIGWDEKHFLLEHRFLCGGETMAFGLVKARFLKKTGGSVLTSELLTAAAINETVPPLSDFSRLWLSSVDAHLVHVKS